jgi:putative acetyltransferase
MSLVARRTTFADPALRPLIGELDAELHRIYDRVQDAYDDFNLLPPDTRAVLIVDGDDAIGCGCFKHDGAEVEIKRVYVTPRARRRGVAAVVMGELETWAREVGATTVVLETGYLQDAAIALYERLGYTRTQAFGPYIGMDASVCMRKAL